MMDVLNPPPRTGFQRKDLAFGSDKTARSNIMRQSYYLEIINGRIITQSKNTIEFVTWFLGVNSGMSLGFGNSLASLVDGFHKII